jgi:hypothetical protein
MASRMAHFDDETHSWRLWDRRSCLDAVKFACQQVDGAVRIREFEMMHLVEPHIYPSPATVRQYCGWSHAIQAAGYSPNRRGRAGQRDYEVEGDLSSTYFG